LNARNCNAEDLKSNVGKSCRSRQQNEPLNDSSSSAYRLPPPLKTEAPCSSEMPSNFQRGSWRPKPENRSSRRSHTTISNLILYIKLYSVTSLEVQPATFRLVARIPKVIQLMSTYTNNNLYYTLNSNSNKIRVVRGGNSTAAMQDYTTLKVRLVMNMEPLIVVQSKSYEGICLGFLVWNHSQDNTSGDIETCSSRIQVYSVTATIACSPDRYWVNNLEWSIWGFTPMSMKNAVFWDLTPCGSCKNRCFGGTYRLHHRGRKN
jgi:hypothetical protein